MEGEDIVSGVESDENKVILSYDNKFTNFFSHTLSLCVCVFDGRRRMNGKISFLDA